MSHKVLVWNKIMKHKIMKHKMSSIEFLVFAEKMCLMTLSNNLQNRRLVPKSKYFSGNMERTPSLLFALCVEIETPITFAYENLN